MYNFESGFQHGMWDLCRRSGVKYLRLGVDICCLQEVRWKGQGAKMIADMVLNFFEVGVVKQKMVWV